MTVLTVPVPTPVRSRQARLLLTDAGLSGALGLALAAAAGPVADLLGTDATTTVRWVGVALVLLAVDLVLLARSRFVRPAVLAAGVGSLAWEAASLVTAAVADLSTTGTVLVVAQGLVFGALGLLQLRSARA